VPPAAGPHLDSLTQPWGPVLQEQPPISTDARRRLRLAGSVFDGKPRGGRYARRQRVTKNRLARSAEIPVSPGHAFTLQLRLVFAGPVTVAANCCGFQSPALPWLETIETACGARWRQTNRAGTKRRKLEKRTKVIAQRESANKLVRMDGGSTYET